MTQRRVSRKRPTVMIADDHLMFAIPAGRYLARHYEVLAPTATLDAIDEAVVQLRPDIVLLDLMFGKRNALTMLAHLVRSHVDTRFVIVTGFPSRDFLNTAVRLGARGFVLKEDGPAELVLAIQLALAGQTYIPPAMQDGRGECWCQAARELTTRQEDVLAGLRQRLTEPQIAEKLHLSLSSVEKHVAALKRTLGLVGRKQDVSWPKLTIVPAPRSLDIVG